MTSELKVISTHFGETQQLTPDNRLQDLVVVRYTLSDGSTGSISVPRNEFEPENIKALLADEVRKRQEINDGL